MNRHSALGANTNLICKNNCGYYGNPCWDNYCSRCFREAQLKTNRMVPAIANLSNVSSRAFSKFEAKRQKVAGKSKSTVRKILKRPDDQYESGSSIPDEAVQAKMDFYRILKTWRSAPASDVSKQITKLLRELEVQELSDPTRFSNAVKDFYTHMSQRIYNNRVYQDTSTDRKEDLINAIERFLSIWIYPWAFTPRNSGDEEVDLKLQDRIRSLHWVSHIHLDAPIDPSLLDQSRYLEGAILTDDLFFAHPCIALIRLNEVLSTEAKLDQVVNCCREVFHALRINTETSSPGGTAADPKGSPRCVSKQSNADDFLPALIWVVLRANPPLLHSNLQFVMRFASETRLNTGEAAYYFTNLCCAVEFIKKLNHESLGMTKQEFDAQMLNGVSVTLCPVEIPNALSANERRYNAISKKIEELDLLITETEQDLHLQQSHQTQRIVRLRQQRPLKKTVYLDPRELETPHILCLGPPEKSLLPFMAPPSSSMYWGSWPRPPRVDPATAAGATQNSSTLILQRQPSSHPNSPPTNIFDKLALGGDADEVQTPCLTPSTVTPPRR